MVSGVLAVALLMTPVDAGEWQTVLAADLLALGLDSESIDPDEAKRGYIGFTNEGDLLAQVRARVRECWDYPRVGECGRFPDHWTVRDWRETRPSHAIEQAWWATDEKCSIVVRRRALHQLRLALGDTAFYSGDLK